MTLKQSQGHQTCNDNFDPEQGYNHAKFVKSENWSIISFEVEYVQKWTIVVYSISTYLKILQSYNFIGREHKIFT